MKRLARQLLHKSQEAFILAIEIFNKPTISYRLEGFSFFYINAWELLLKAKIIEDTKKDATIFYDKKTKTRSITLSDALKKVFTNEKDPVRKNIEVIDELRNSATHLVVKELEPVYVGVFQAGVLNYTNHLRNWFGKSITDKISPAMLSLVYDIKTLDPIVIEKQYGKEILDFIMSVRQNIELETQSSGNTFSIPIEYRLVLTKSTKDSDIVLTHNESGKVPALLLNVPKNIEQTHPYRLDQAVEQIRKKLGKDYLFNRHDLLCILKKEKIKETANPKFYHKLSNPETHYYSEAFIDFVVNRIRQNSTYLQNARDFYKISIKGSNQKPLVKSK